MSWHGTKERAWRAWKARARDYGGGRLAHNGQESEEHGLIDGVGGAAAIAAEEGV